jgi:diadenosine tetraphosphate (Ap4A) HIT family hydrolase
MARRRVDFSAVRRRLAGRCFICELISGNPEFAHHVVYEDADAIAFLNKYPPLAGYAIVAPRAHREHVTNDFSTDDYARLQRVVHRIGVAVSAATPTERLYILSLGSKQGNSHVHWHIAPLPPDVPFEQQQLAALDADPLDLTDDEFAEIARRIRAALD